MSVTSQLANQHVALESENAHDQCQSASRLQTCLQLTLLSQSTELLTVSIVVSTIAVFRLVDNLMPSLQIVH